LLFSVPSWLLSLAVSRCYFADPAVKKSELPQPKLVWSLFFRCIISDISQRPEDPARELPARRH
jgi:hypothetical protein